MTSNNIIKTAVDGTAVEGVVIRSRFEFSVTMTKPHKGLTSGSHIPFFARRYDFDGKSGDQRILEVLGRLFEQGVQGRVE